MSTDTGGPAFPSPLEWRVTRNADGETGVYDNANDGMSLRDYFANGALMAVVAVNGLVPARFTEKDIAGAAYAIADAMLRERDKPR